MLVFSCAGPTKSPENKPEAARLQEAEAAQEPQKPLFEKEKQELHLTLAKAQRTFSADSASLARFYLRTFPAETKEDFKKQLARLEDLMAKEIVDKYQSVVKELKPLLVEAIEAKSLSPHEATRFSELYAIYDDLGSESLCSQVLEEDENYTLVWNAIRMIVKRSSEDTTYLRALMTLSDGISTNVELAEGMQDFLPEGIKNNPEGFVAMFASQPAEGKVRFARYATKWEDPVRELMTLFDSLSQTAPYGTDAQELIKSIEGQDTGH